MDLYYNDRLNEYQREIGSMRKILILKKKTVDFIKKYCGDYFSLIVNIVAVSLWIFKKVMEL